MFDGDADDEGGWVRELGWGLRATGLAAIVNLNCATPPAWTGQSNGPLFPEPPARTLERLECTRGQLLAALIATFQPDVRIDWHYSELDLTSGNLLALLQIAKRMLGKISFSLVPDRPNQPTALAEGIDRERPELLGAICLSLSRLAPDLRGRNF